MSNKTVEKTDRDTDPPTDAGAPHPLDMWLKRELQALYGGPEPEPLPPGIAELATQLEERLGQAGDDATGGDSGQGKAADGERASPGRGSKR